MFFICNNENFLLNDVYLSSQLVKDILTDFPEINSIPIPSEYYTALKYDNRLELLKFYNFIGVEDKDINYLSKQIGEMYEKEESFPKDFPEEILSMIIINYPSLIHNEKWGEVYIPDRFKEIRENPNKYVSIFIHNKNPRPIEDYVKSGNLTLVEYLLDEYTENLKNNLMTPKEYSDILVSLVDYACQYNQLEIVKYLLLLTKNNSWRFLNQRNCISSYINAMINKIKYLASKYGKLNIFKWILEIHPNDNYSNHRCKVLAITNGHVDILKYLIKIGNLYVSMEETDISYTAINSRHFVLSILLDNVNMMKYLKSLLHIDNNFLDTGLYGIHPNNIELYKEFFTYNEGNNYPLLIIQVCDHNNLDIIKLLEQKGLIFNETTLFKFILNGNEDIINHFKERIDNVEYFIDTNITFLEKVKYIESKIPTLNTLDIINRAVEIDDFDTFVYMMSKFSNHSISSIITNIIRYNRTKMYRYLYLNHHELINIYKDYILFYMLNFLSNFDIIKEITNDFDYDSNQIISKAIKDNKLEVLKYFHNRAKTFTYDTKILLDAVSTENIEILKYLNDNVKIIDDEFPHVIFSSVVEGLPNFIQYLDEDPVI